MAGDQLAPNDGGAELRAAIAAGLDALTAWAAGITPADLPAAVLDKAALVLVDDLAAIAAASREPEIKRLVAALDQPTASEATLFVAGGGRAGRQDAALINAIAGCWCEFDEGYRGAPCHAGLYVLPALLAETEAAGATLGEVLARLAVAYEVSARLAECWRFPPASVHPHAAMAGMGAAVAVALARGRPSPVMRRALAIAGGLVPAGHYDAAIEGALVRNLWAGHGAQIGIQAVGWAEAGLDGFADGPHTAFITLLGAGAEPSALTAALGTRWAILGCYHKRHGCCHSTHCAIEAALELRSALRGETGSIRQVTLLTHRPSMSNPSPANPLAARFSFEHVVAATLVHGHAEPSAFARDAIGDLEIARLRRVVQLHLYSDLPPWPHDRAARLEVELASGGHHVATCLSAPGGPDRPLGPAELLAKAERVAGSALPRFTETAARIVGGELRQQTWRELAHRLTA